MSPPAENARSPAPVTTIAPMSSSASSSLQRLLQLRHQRGIERVQLLGPVHASPARPARAVRSALAHPATPLLRRGIGRCRRRCSRARASTSSVCWPMLRRRRVRISGWRALHIHARPEQLLMAEHRVVDLRPPSAASAPARCRNTARRSAPARGHARLGAATRPTPPRCALARCFSSSTVSSARCLTRSRTSAKRGSVQQLRRADRVAQPLGTSLAAGLDDHAAVATPDSTPVGSEMGW